MRRAIGQRGNTTHGAVAIARTLRNPAGTGAIVGLWRAQTGEGVIGAAGIELDASDLLGIEQVTAFAGCVECFRSAGNRARARPLVFRFLSIGRHHLRNERCKTAARGKGLSDVNWGAGSNLLAVGFDDASVAGLDRFLISGGNRPATGDRRHESIASIKRSAFDWLERREPIIAGVRINELVAHHSEASRQLRSASLIS
jgi:hypothetical protein